MTNMKNIKEYKKIHFTGIKGVGMTALALCCKDIGIKLSGSDIKETFVTDAVLSKANIDCQPGFDKKRIMDTELCIFTGAHRGEENIEVQAAKNSNIPVMPHAEALASLMEHKKGISVCGVGGKTTTTAMISTLFSFAGLNPSYAIGVGEIPGLGFPGKYSSTGKHFIAEADEYFTSPQDKTPRFMYQNPETIVLTNIEYDHPDVYKNLDHTLSAFANFIDKLPEKGRIIACADNKNNKKLLKKLNKNNVITYGFSENSNFQIIEHRQINKKNIFSLKCKEKNILMKNIELNVPGKFNVLNASAALIVGLENNIDKQSLKKGIEGFKGTKRRFELIKRFNNLVIYDDYAHHPMEIEKTLQAAKKWEKNKEIIAIFQPHTYSRTKKFLNEFSKSFNSADQVIIVDIYSSSREAKDPEVSGQLLAEKIKANNPQTVYLPGKKELCHYLGKKDFKNSLILTMGAGNIFLWHKEMIECLRNNHEY